MKTRFSPIRHFHIYRKECLVDQPGPSSKLLKIIIPDNPIYERTYAPTHLRIKIIQIRFRQRIMPI